MYSDPSPIPIDRTCDRCALNCGLAVAGRGPTNLKAIRLIAISDYPGAYETEYDFPQVPNDWAIAQKQKPYRIMPSANSGKFIRDALAEYELDQSNIWFTNAIKCDPKHQGRNLNPLKKYLEVCHATWLHKELVTIDSLLPKIPILVMGSWALLAIQKHYANLAPAGKVGNLLRRSNLKADLHPLVVTFNPAAYARANARIETSLTIHKRTKEKQIAQVMDLDKLMHLPTQVYRDDLKLLKIYL